MDKRGATPARVIFQELPPEKQAKMLVLFKRFAESGRIENREQFHKLGSRAGTRGSGLGEFKRSQDRFLGDVRPGGRFLIAAYQQKKTDLLDPNVIARAVRVLAENDEYEKSNQH